MKSLNELSYNNSNSSGLITWTGPCIECLGIKTGDNLNVAVYKIATELCTVLEPFDLSTLTLQCALDIFNKEESGNRTLLNVLQLLIDNECGLKELIDNLQDQVDGLSEDNFVIDLKCLAETDGFGNPLPYTNQSVAQQFVNEICDLKDDVATLSGNLTELTDIVNDLEIPSGDEVVVTTCISGPKPVSEALEDVADDYCTYKDVVGSIAQIQTAIGRQTAAMNTLMSGVTGWVTTPTTEAQWLNNIGLLLTNLMGRVAANELCCASGCDDLKVGFLTDFDGTTVILKFTSGAGTFIPSGFIDNGTTVTISDNLGNSVTYDIVITQNGETEALDLSIFTIGSVLSFSLDVKMKVVDDEDVITLSCEKCVGKDVKYLNDDCCVITASEEVTIIYKTCGVVTP